MATRRMKSADNLSADRWDDAAETALLPAYAPETTNGKSTPAGWGSQKVHKNTNDQPTGRTEEDKWIHRDKLAKIESQELQAAGLFVPRSRAPSKQRRDRSRSAMRRGTDDSQNTTQTRSRKNSNAVEQRASDHTVHSWDLRTPEEIAEEEAHAYFTTTGLRGGSRIPVAKTSPAPIALDYLERGSPATRNLSESPENEPQTMAKSRSRSASASLRGLEKPSSSGTIGTLAGAKRSATDMSPKKNTTASRKMSSGAKSINTLGRPKTRPGSSQGTRPSTRSGLTGESPPTKQPEGDPPWMINSYKPDPRLPPDQQLLPTVARRLQQERWEKEGTYGDVFDKEFRPLNDKTAFLRPPFPEKQAEETPASPIADEWPLKPESKSQKSPSIRQGQYSTMPKISDKPLSSPIGSPRQPQTPQTPAFQSQVQSRGASRATQRVPEEKEDVGQKGGCGCCVVM